MPVEQAPILYLPHGGGPLPLMADRGHLELVNFLQTVGSTLGRPAAILVVSAHWEAPGPMVQSGATPGLFYDYYGFPPESYKIQYPAPGHPQLAHQIRDQLKAAGFDAVFDPNRGFDHGVFVPLKLIFPEADIPCFQISLIKGLDPAQHIALGRSLQFLRDMNVLIIGSGMSFHNMRAFFSGGLSEPRPDLQFNDWLAETCTSTELSGAEREQRLIAWESAPAARFCHPREEHLLPLHVCFGAAGIDASPADLVFNGEVLGTKVAAFLWC